MSGYQFTPQAIEDLFEIWSYIAGDDLEAASRVEEAIYAACAFLADALLAGRIREDLTSLPLRFWVVQPYRNYLIVGELIGLLRPGAISTACGVPGEGFPSLCRTMRESVKRRVLPPAQSRGVEYPFPTALSGLGYDSIRRVWNVGETHGGWST